MGSGDDKEKERMANNYLQNTFLPYLLYTYTFIYASFFSNYHVQKTIKPKIGMQNKFTHYTSKKQYALQVYRGAGS